MSDGVQWNIQLSHSVRFRAMQLAEVMDSEESPSAGCATSECDPIPSARYDAGDPAVARIDSTGRSSPRDLSVAMISRRASWSPTAAA